MIASPMTTVVDRLSREWLAGPDPRHWTRDPAEMWRAAGKQPDPWQLAVTSSTAQQMLLLCSRQSGKSTAAAAAAYRVAVTVPGSTTLIISRSLRQAGELKRKVDEFHWAVQGEKRGRAWERAARRLTKWQMARRDEIDDEDAVRNSVLSLELGNGSRILAMPCMADTAVGFTIDLLIYDEAARIPDHVYAPMRMTLARARSQGKGRLLALSTPNGKQGWFWEAWRDAQADVAAGRRPDWECYNVIGGRVTPDGQDVELADCGWLTRDFLRSELRAIGRRWFCQEYSTQFVDALDQVFSQEDIARALRAVDDGVVQEDV